MLLEAVVLGLVWDVLAVGLVVVVGLLGAAVAVGVPAYVGYTAYETASTNDLSNPAALGFTAGFLVLLIGGFIAMLVFVYAG